MAMRTCLVALPLAALALVVGCGSSPPPPTATQPTAAASSSSSSSPTSSSSTPADSGGRCVAATARHRPAGWIESGKLVVALKDGQPTSFEAQDASGKVVESKPAPPNGKEAEALMGKLTCRVGGLIALLEGPEPSKQGTATVSLPVLKPKTSDEKIDLATICKEPADMPKGAPHGPDESQKVRIAFDLFLEQLTTPKWRGWLVDVLEASRQANNDAERLSMRKTKADELQGAATKAGVTGACWFATGLRTPPPPP